MNNTTLIETLIADTVQKFEEDLCREVAKAYDEGEIIAGVEVEIELETDNLEDVIDDAVQKLRKEMSFVDTIFDEDRAEELRKGLEDALKKNLRKDLLPNAKTLEALRNGILVHPTPKEPMVDDGKEYRPYTPPVNNAGTKALERLISQLQEHGAPAEFFVGKSGEDIMEGLATLLKMHTEAVNLARKFSAKAADI